MTRVGGATLTSAPPGYMRLSRPLRLASPNDAVPFTRLTALLRQDVM